jgi:5'(3')-deoxyribonucleotidase
MRIGFDVDGVLADFITAYQKLVVKFAGVDLFRPGDNVNPPVWDWPEHRGYSKDVTRRVWKHIIEEDPRFWANLGTVEGARTLAFAYYDLVQRHDLYFITSRPSNFGAKRQTEEWLERRIGVRNPTVLISSEKGKCCDALKLDAYIDDYAVNIEACVSTRISQIEQAKAKGVEPTPTKVFCLDRNYNSEVPQSEHIIHVKTVGQMLDYLVLDL